MPNIRITEQDLTAVSVNVQTEDVVFIPGFVSSVARSPASLVKAMVPTYCETVEEFEMYFGASTPLFLLDQEYAATNWKSYAIPSGGIMRRAGDADYGYLMAKRLLQMGIPVVYCRCNGDIGPMYGTFDTESELPASSTLLPTDVGKVAFVSDTSTYYIIVNTTDEQGQDIIQFRKTHYANENEGLNNIVDPSIDDLYAFMRGVQINSLGCPVRDQYGAVVPEIDNNMFALVSDPGTFNIKYLTSGGYPTFEFSSGNNNIIVYNMLQASGSNSGRQDCIALIDHSNKPDRNLSPSYVVTETTESGDSVVTDCSVYYAVNNLATYTDTSEIALFDNYGDHAAMFTPWCEYTTSDGQITAMAGSYGFLTALANSLMTNGNWLAIAGVNRGRPPYFVQPYLTGQILTNKIADEYSSYNIAINAITDIKPYGYTIWGNRTLRNNRGVLTASSYLNIRSMISDIRKIAYQASRALMFEQNNDILWVNFKAKMSPLLDKLVSGYGLKKYSITKLNSTEKNKLIAKITIYPIYAVEAFDITIVLEDDDE